MCEDRDEGLLSVYAILSHREQPLEFKHILCHEQQYSNFVFAPT